jgi:transposase
LPQVKLENRALWVSIEPRGGFSVTRSRKNHTPEQKVAILRRHLLDGVPVSDLCDELGLNPNVFYVWQKQFFENGAAAFQKQRGRQVDRRDETIAKLEAKLTQKNEVLAELMQEHVQLKKELGEL